jgi:hypothetical protein
MNDLEKKIEETSISTIMDIRGWSLLGTKILSKLYIAALKSPEAKEYWQQGMYSEEEVKEAFEAGQQSVEAVDDEKWGLCPVYTKSFVQWFKENKKE